MGLISVLNGNPLVKIHNTDNRYSHPSNLEKILDLSEEETTGDHLLFNSSLSSDTFYKFAKFVYVVRDARSTLNAIMEDDSIDYTYETAMRYYSFRLRRLCEMAKRTPGAIMLTWQNMKDKQGLDLVENYLELDDSLYIADSTFWSDDLNEVPEEFVEKAQDRYEAYLYYLKQLDLRRVE